MALLKRMLMIDSIGRISSVERDMCFLFDVRNGFAVEERVARRMTRKDLHLVLYRCGQFTLQRIDYHVALSYSKEREHMQDSLWYVPQDRCVYTSHAELAETFAREVRNNPANPFGFIAPSTLAAAA